MWYALFKYVLIGPALRLLTRPRVVGREHLPAGGPYIVAANHLAMIDSLILCLVLPRRLTFVAKREYFEGTGLLGALQRWFFSASRMRRNHPSTPPAASSTSAASGPSTPRAPVPATASPTGREPASCGSPNEQAFR